MGIGGAKKVMFSAKDTNGVDGSSMINLGLAASAVMVNNVIAVLHGSKAPIVLRPVDGSESRWSVISQCYLEDWMYSTGKTLDWRREEANTFLLI